MDDIERLARALHVAYCKVRSRTLAEHGREVPPMPTWEEVDEVAKVVNRKMAKVLLEEHLSAVDWYGS